MNLKSSILEVSDQLKDAIKIRTEELLNEIDHTHSLPSNDKPLSQNIYFTFDNTLLTSCRSYGQLCTTSVSPSRTYVMRGGVNTATVDEAAYVEIHLITEDGSPCHDIVPVAVKLLNIHNELECTGEKMKVENNIVTYRYIPYEPGPHQLHVTILDKPVSGSPFNVTINMPLRLRCIPTSILSGVFWKPGGIALGPLGELAVIDSRGYSTVQVYNSQMELMMSFGAWGSGVGQCYEPIGVTFDLSGDILVVDGGNHRIHKFNREGKHVVTVGQKGKEAMEFLRPTGICVNKAGWIYVCDRSNHRVQILKPNLMYDSYFGEYGEERGNFHYPWDIDCDSEGFLYVVDAGNKCIKKFTSYGTFQKKIGPMTTGLHNDELKCPEMICVDEYDYIYVTDRELNKVIVFDTNGVYHTSFGESGSGKGQFYQPRGIAKGRDGTCYISEVGNKRVQQFK